MILAWGSWKNIGAEEWVLGAERPDIESDLEHLQPDYGSERSHSGSKLPDFWSEWPHLRQNGLGGLV